MTKFFARVAVPVPLTPIDALLDYIIPEEFINLVKPGSLIEVTVGRKKLWALVFEVHNKAPKNVPIEKFKKVAAVFLDRPIMDAQRLSVLKWLSDYYVYPIGECVEASLPASVRDCSPDLLLKSLQKVLVQTGNFGITSSPPKHQLNESQKNVYKNILGSKKLEHVLFGITGSGKTEVYLELIDHALKEGKGALVLVPEISLTPQTIRRFEERFPGLVANFHSAMKPTDQRRQWLEVLYEKKKIVVGARSALFVPVPKLGLIIVDEEHDNSYKQEDRLKYCARDVASQLSNAFQIPLILGSATPSLEAFEKTRRGIAVLHKLEERAQKSSVLPQVELVDLRKQIPVENKTSNPEGEFFEPSLEYGDFFLSPRMRQEISKVLEAKEQSILFLNRRGVASELVCRKCGSTAQCPNCDVGLTLHNAGLLCHYCGYQSLNLDICDKCHFTPTPYIRVGVGTASIESSLKAHFPQARVLRLDRDSVSNFGDLQEILHRFSQKEADILVGTQMVAKGHDFPNVTLVGILLAELGLGVPDFRATETNLQLLTQVAGRAGRAQKPGRVLVQTFNPEQPTLQLLQNFKGLGDYESFTDAELAKRKMFHYSPCASTVLIRFDGLDEEKVYKAARKVTDALKKISADGFFVLGPVDSPLSRLRMRYRKQIFIKSLEASTLEKSLHWISSVWHQKKMEKSFQTRLTIDRDPVSML